MHTFQINVLFQFLASSICFKHHVFIIKKTISTRSFVMVCFSHIYVSSLAGGRMCSTLPSTWEMCLAQFKNWTHQANFCNTWSLYEKPETEVTYLRGETLSSTIVEPSSPSMPKWSFDFFCKYKHKNLSTSFETIKKFIKLRRTQNFLSTWLTFWCIYNRIFPPTWIYRPTSTQMCIYV